MYVYCTDTPTKYSNNCNSNFPGWLLQVCSLLSFQARSKPDDHHPRSWFETGFAVTSACHSSGFSNAHAT